LLLYRAVTFGSISGSVSSDEYTDRNFMLAHMRTRHAGAGSAHLRRERRSFRARRLTRPSLSARSGRERHLCSQSPGPSPLNHWNDFSRPALRHGSLNSLSALKQVFLRRRRQVLAPPTHTIREVVIGRQLPTTSRRAAPRMKKGPPRDDVGAIARSLEPKGPKAHVLKKLVVQGGLM